MLSMLLGVTACGNQTNSDKDGVVKTEQSDSKKEFSITLEKVFPGVDEMVTLPLGTTFKKKQVNCCSIKIPENYLINAGYYDGVLVNSIFEMAAGDKTVKDSIDAGLLNQKKDIRYFQVSNSNLVAKDKSKDKDSLKETTILTGVLYSSEELSYDMVKGQSDGYKELEDNGAFYYQVKDKTVSTDLTLCYPISENILLLLDYEGPVSREKEMEEVAKELYDLIEVN